MKKIIYIALLVVALIVIALIVVGCGSIYENPPVGIGREFSELKKSPCACLELKKASLPAWLV